MSANKTHVSGSGKALEGTGCALVDYDFRDGQLACCRSPMLIRRDHRAGPGETRLRALGKGSGDGGPRGIAVG